ncbi:hypothetical protein [Halobaculum gomorrense]|uniref:DUF7998 domain-containing protein n=1 Tax=Halobaculum gomorrense TaxID=43928 RepID=A0A1M5PNY9_9EURY|nr:hypothetical protein [Halobaculum gomorrense]SHH03428.1 hypothetical protein SAMN05443636_1684 [Halobaculum gomorrense]
MFDLPIGGSDAAVPPESDDGSGDGHGAGSDDGRPSGTDSERFDPVDEFVPASLPEPGPFLREGDAEVLTGDAHVAVRDTARTLFEERGVRDATFGYVLTTLDRDRNHPDAGFRYARVPGGDRDGDSDSDEVLRAEFTPTTGFCPQGGALATAAFRAWNADPERHGFDRVVVRVSPTYHASDAVNEQLADAAVSDP